jgi:ribosomal protein S1
MPSDDEWAAAETMLSPGVSVRGTVLSHRPFGFFVRLDDHPGVPGLVQVVDYKPDGVQPRYDQDRVLDPPYPEIGTSITAAVLWLRESNRQILLRSPA